jgi:Tfp pilus assembly protein PilF
MKFRSKHPVSFGILYFFITFSIVSNIPFLIGTNYAERLLYTPSLGIFIAVAWALHHFLGAGQEYLNTLGEYFSSQKKVFGVLAVPVLIYAGMTVMRNPVWKNNDTLYSTDVLISDRSAKTHYFYGNHLTMNDSLTAHADDTAEWSRRVNIGITEFRKAIELNPEYAEATQRLGEMFFHKKQYDSSEVYYRKAIALTPGMATYHNNFGRMLFSIGRYAEAETEFKEAIRLNPYYSTAHNNLAGCYGMQASEYVMKMQTDTLHATEHGQKATELYQLSIATSLQAIKVDPTFINAYETTAQTYKNLGDPANSQNYMLQAQQLETSGKGHR